MTRRRPLPARRRRTFLAGAVAARGRARRRVRRRRRRERRRGRDHRRRRRPATTAPTAPTHAAEHRPAAWRSSWCRDRRPSPASRSPSTPTATSGSSTSCSTCSTTRHVKMTSFIVGNWLEANPDMAKRIADGGHEFANHTYTHPSFVAALAATRSSTRSCAVATCSSASPADPGPRSGRRAPTTAPCRPGDQVLVGRGARPGTPPCSASTSTRSTTTTPVRTSVTQRTLAAVHAGLDREPALRARGHGGRDAGDPRRPRAAQPHAGHGLDPVGLSQLRRQRPKWFIRSNNLGRSRRGGPHGTHRRSRASTSTTPNASSDSNTTRCSDGCGPRTRCTGSPTSSRAAATGTS